MMVYQAGSMVETRRQYWQKGEAKSKWEAADASASGGEGLMRRAAF